MYQCFGDGLFDGVTEDATEASKSSGGIGIPILNPFSQEEILKKIELRKASDPVAMGIVIDSTGLPHLKSRPDAGTKTPEQIRKLKAAVYCSFIVKGVLNTKCAELAVDAGADAIIVSNHGGRVLPGAPATAEVLPETVEAVGGKAKIIVDGGIRSGYDIFKAIALGADAVMICRPRARELLRRHGRHKSLHPKAQGRVLRRNVYVRCPQGVRHRRQHDMIRLTK